MCAIMSDCKFTSRKGRTQNGEGEYSIRDQDTNTPAPSPHPLYTHPNKYKHTHTHTCTTAYNLYDCSYLTFETFFSTYQRIKTMRTVLRREVEFLRKTFFN